MGTAAALWTVSGGLARDKRCPLWFASGKPVSAASGGGEAARSNVDGFLVAEDRGDDAAEITRAEGLREVLVHARVVGLLHVGGI